MVDDNAYTYPSSGGASFSKAEWARAKRAIARMDARLRATCKHLIKSGKPLVIKRVDYKKAQEERELLEQKLLDAERAAQGYE